MVYIIIHPLSIKDKSHSECLDPEIVSEYSDKEWRRILRETRRVCKEYRQLYGVYVRKVEKFNDSFIKINASVENIKIFYERSLNLKDEVSLKNLDKYPYHFFDTYLEEEFCVFLNHSLRENGYPSFYKNNWEDPSFYKNNCEGWGTKYVESFRSFSMF